MPELIIGTGPTQAQQARSQTSLGFPQQPTANFSVGDVLGGIRDAASAVVTGVGTAVRTGGSVVGDVLGGIVNTGAEIIRDPRTIEALTGLLVLQQQQEAQEDIIKEQRRAAEAQRAAQIAQNDAALQVAREQLRQSGFSENPADVAARLQSLETSQGRVLFDPETGVVFGGPGGGSGAGSPAPSFSSVSQGVTAARNQNSQIWLFAAAGIAIYLYTRE